MLEEVKAKKFILLLDEEVSIEELKAGEARLKKITAFEGCYFF
ncbi:hypothetical protein RCO48_38880 [Peribacillus frigoritolerans]|nr:hypothetical protein [Peribacillus frigoritolerans]